MDLEGAAIAIGAAADPGVVRPGKARFAPSVLLTKAEVFGACQALSDADRVLVRTGRLAEAGALGDLFELLEERLSALAVSSAVRD